MKREIGLAGAIMMGLGSILGTGVFVSIGIAAGVAGANVCLRFFSLRYWRFATDSAALNWPPATQLAAGPMNTAIAG